MYMLNTPNGMIDFSAIKYPRITNDLSGQKERLYLAYPDLFVAARVKDNEILIGEICTMQCQHEDWNGFSGTSTGTTCRDRGFDLTKSHFDS